MKNLTEPIKNSIATITPKLGPGIEAYKIEVSAEKMWELKRVATEAAFVAKKNPESASGIIRHLAYTFTQLLGMSKEEVFKPNIIKDQEEFWKD